MQKTAAAAALAAALALAAPWASAQGHHGHDMKPMMRANGEKMMSMPMTGDPDVDFAKMMREHHKGGVEMAQWQLEHGRDPKMRAMARRIIESQKKEIAQFDSWLAKNRRSAEEHASR